MLKKIKTTKKIDFFELVKGVQTGIYKHGDYRVVGRIEGSVCVDLGGFILEDPDNKILFTDSFTVEIEEPITEDTVFKCLLEIIDGELVYIRNKKTIKESVKDDTDRFYALIDGKLQLVWERDGE